MRKIIKDRINKRILTANLVLLFVGVMLLHLQAHADEPNFPKPPYSVEQLRAWHESMEPWPWLGQPEQKVDLRNGKGEVLLLAVSGYARGITCVLFTKLNGAWSQISNEIEQAHHPIRLLKTTTNGWHDFQSFVPLWGSGGKEVLVSTYGWNGKKYVLKKSETGMWRDYEPFKSELK